MADDAGTLVSLFHGQAERLADRTCLKIKSDGQWRDVSWTELIAQANRWAAALVDLGVRPGDRVVILAENRIEWIVADIGLLTAAGINVPIHAPLTAKQVAYQLNDSGAAIVVVSNADQLAKLVDASAECPGVRHVVAFDALNVPSDVRWEFHRWSDMLDAGADSPRLADMPGYGIDRVSPEDLATIMYTSGTTGEPKGVMLTHANLVSNSLASLEVFALRHDDVKLCWLPVSHIFARTADYYATLAAGAILALAECYETLMDNLQEVRPHLMSSVPHFYENIVRELTERGLTEAPDALRNILGGRMRVCVSGGAPLPPHLAEFITERGITLLEGYGLTETSPVISSNTPDANRIGTVGRAIPGVEVRIADDGEVLTRGPHVMKGYWNKPEATAETIRDGWLYTGDLGSLDEDGFLRITGRKKEIIVTAGGKNIAPRYIEHLMTEDPIIDQAVIFGDRRKFLSALIVPNFEMLGPEAEKIGVNGQTPDELVADPNIYTLIEQRVMRALSEVSKYEQVRKFVLLARPFTIQAGELTPTLKVRREQVYQRYRERIDALYDA
jgi:long-chain acyl-CoA synthetase